MAKRDPIPKREPPREPKPGPDAELGEAELEVMRVLWDRGPGTVRDVLTVLHADGRQLAYTTVLTVLTRLEQKRFVKSNKGGSAYIYSPRVSREHVTRSRIGALVEQLYDGSPAPLVLQLIKSGGLSPTDLAELRRMIDDLDAQGGAR